MGVLRETQLSAGWPVVRYALESAGVPTQGYPYSVTVWMSDVRLQDKSAQAGQRTSKEGLGTSKSGT